MRVTLIKANILFYFILFNNFCKFINILLTADIIASVFLRSEFLAVEFNYV